MGKRPAFQFYPGDWMKDPALRRCSPAARGAWIDLICFLFESDTPGILRSNGVPWAKEEAARAAGVTESEIDELVNKGVMKFSRRTGTYWSKRILMDEISRRHKAANGKKGGVASKHPSKTQANRKQNSSKPEANAQAKSGSSSSSSTSSSEYNKESAAASPRKWSETDYQNAVSLRDQILSIDPDYIHGAKIDLEKWADEFRLVRERDHRSQQDIAFILERFPHDGFWSKTIRSPGSLRGMTKSGKDKFLTILSSVKEQNGKSNATHQTFAIPEHYLVVLRGFDSDAKRRNGLRKIGYPDWDTVDLDRLLGLDRLPRQHGSPEIGGAKIPVPARQPA